MLSAFVAKSTILLILVLREAGEHIDVSYSTVFEIMVEKKYAAPVQTKIYIYMVRGKEGG